MEIALVELEISLPSKAALGTAQKVGCQLTILSFTSDARPGHTGVCRGAWKTGGA